MKRNKQLSLDSYYHFNATQKGLIFILIVYLKDLDSVSVRFNDSIIFYFQATALMCIIPFAAYSFIRFTFMS